MSQTDWRRSALAMPFVALGLVVSLAAQQAPRVIEVKAKKYDFEPSTIEVQQGERVVLRVTSTDRLHGIGIKKFGVNREVPEGRNRGRGVRRVERRHLQGALHRGLRQGARRHGRHARREGGDAVTRRLLAPFGARAVPGRSRLRRRLRREALRHRRTVARAGADVLEHRRRTSSRAPTRRAAPRARSATPTRAAYPAAGSRPAARRGVRSSWSAWRASASPAPFA